MSLLPPAIKSLILDMDGVLWKENHPIGDLQKIFRTISQRGLKVCLATNNSTQTPEQYLERLRGFGVDTIEAWQIVSSSHALAAELCGHFPSGSEVYTIGETGLRQALAEKGLVVIDEENAGHAQKIQAVAVGMDRTITFAKLRRVTTLIRQGIPFYATNPDRTFPTPDGLIPGTGALLAALVAASEVEPVIVGKPAPFMINLACQRLGTTPEETLVVGDRLETDIAGGQAAGCPVVLVLSGVSTREMAEAWRPVPDIIVPELAALIG